MLLRTVHPPLFAVLESCAWSTHGVPWVFACGRRRSSPSWLGQLPLRQGAVSRNDFHLKVLKLNEEFQMV
jgi:hypothetical protein